MAAKRKTASKGTKKPKPQDDVVGWARSLVFGSSKKKAGKGKGPKFSEDAVGWLIKLIRGK